MANFRSAIGGVRTVFLATALIILASCKRSHDEAKNIKRTESQLDLPEMSVEEKKNADKCLEWNMATLYDAYDEIGSRNKKWDANAHDALRFFAQVRSYGSNLKGFPALMTAYARRAVELGCDDPMIKYLHARYAKDMTQFNSMQVAKVYAGISDELDASRYAHLRKFYAANRAFENYVKVKPWPDEGNTYIDRATQSYYAALADKSVPVQEIYQAGTEMLAMINRCIDGKSRYDQMETLLLKNWSSEGEAYLLQGEFYTDYAWKGRTSRAATNVTEEQWQMFGERLDLAEKALLRGMEVDPKEGRLPMQMITVASGQGKGLREMKRWWEKAMEADPNNYSACDKLLYFLMPKWYGSREHMIAFGRECATSDKFGGTVPLILADAHYMFNKAYGSTDGSYWLEPDVWPDIKLSFDNFFKRNPKAISWRHNYARYAYWCRQWDVLQEQIGLMGDNINYSYFGGREQYDEMVRHTAEHVSSAKK